MNRMRINGYCCAIMLRIQKKGYMYIFWRNKHGYKGYTEQLLAGQVNTVLHRKVWVNGIEECSSGNSESQTMQSEIANFTSRNTMINKLQNQSKTIVATNDQSKLHEQDQKNCF